jgi:mono/diheme cytochrome c family protein
MDCGGCHTPGALAGQPDQARKFAGSDVGFEQAGGAVVYPPNLTPHATGLAGWSEADILNVLRSGVRPDGRQLAPIMPWQAYSKLADEDAVAIAAYLKSLTPVDHRSPAPANTDTAVAPYLTVKTPLTRPVPGGGSPEPVSPVNPPP